MTKTEMRPYRQILIELQNRLELEQQHLTEEAQSSLGGEGSGGISNLPLHLADLGASAYQEELSIRLLDHETQLHAEVVAALERIEQKTFGLCQECGKKISKLRLASVPYARRCFVCESDHNSGR